MEVHAHSHSHGKKNWKSYFWEFLMLFLAITLGFFVENQREHYIEHQREKQYMQSMIKDLITDVENIALSKAEKKRTADFADSLTQAYISNDYKNNTGHFNFYARNFSIYRNLFFITDGTMMQLKNSGGLRLIRNAEVVDSLQSYDNLYQQFKQSQDRESQFLMGYRDVMEKIFDVKVFSTMVDTYPDITLPEGNSALFNDDKHLLNELLMKVLIAKRNKLANFDYLNRLKEKATNLITLIKKEYHME